MTETDCIRHREKILSSVAFMKTTLNSLVGTYQILLMTINRCTDYTKISHGIPLFPTLETVHLIDTLNAPISCVRELQGRICVELEMMDSNISEYIVTDRQWLQDNVLCLVSNAVKFSLEGTAIVRVFLTSYPSLDSLNGPSDYSNERLLSIQQRSTIISNNLVMDPSNNLMIRIEVEDNGIGLKARDSESMIDLDRDFEELKSVFKEPDLARKREVGGSGLGLHCLAKRIEALRGEYGITARKDHESGCVFWFTLPYVPVTYAEPGTRSISMRSRSSVRPDQRLFDALTETLETEIHSERFRKGSIGSILSVPASESSVSFDSSDRSERRLAKKASSSISLWRSEPDVLKMTDNRHGPVPKADISRKLNDSLSEEGRELRHPHLLVVDDSLPIVKMLKIMLEKNGFVVTTAANGKEAVQIFQKVFEEEVKSLQETSYQKQLDGILMDLQMPVMNGIEAIARIREIERSTYPEWHHQEFNHHHLIVAMSAGSDNETMASAYRAGADEFLPKPFNLQSFQKILEEYPGKENDEELKQLDPPMKESATMI